MSESAAAAAVVQNSGSPTHWQNVLSAHDSPNESERNMKVHVANLPDLTQIETENAIIVGKYSDDREAKQRRVSLSGANKGASRTSMTARDRPRGSLRSNRSGVSSYLCFS